MCYPCQHPVKTENILKIKRGYQFQWSFPYFVYFYSLICLCRNCVWLDGRGVIMMYSVTKVQLISSGSGANQPRPFQTTSLEREFHCQDQGVWTNNRIVKFNAIRRLSDVSHLRFQCSIIIVVIIVMAVSYWILISQIPDSSLIPTLPFSSLYLRLWKTPKMFKISSSL